MGWMNYPRKLWVLALGMMVNVAGMSFLWPLNTLYITQVLGRSMSQAGFILMLHAGAGIFGSLLGGYLHDRIGGKITMMMSSAASTCIVLSLAFYQDWYFYITMMILLGFTLGMIFPVMYALAGGLWPEGGRRSFNLMYITQNLGVAVGSALGGIVAQSSFQYVFWVNGTTYVFFLVLIWLTLPNVKTSRDKKQVTGSNEDSLTEGGILQARGALFFLCFGFMVCWIGYVQWSTSIPTYMNQLGLSLSSYSLLWTINGLLIILIQPISGYVTTILLPSLRQQLVVGVLIFAVSLSVLTQANVYAGFLVAMIIMTLGEILIWPAVPSIASELAPAGKSGIFQGIVNGASTAGRMLGPFIGGTLYDVYGPSILFYCMIGLFGIALLCFACYHRFLKPVPTPTNRQVAT
ncbi:MFS transporter [Ammoniphilus sp. YIM 78166]|uniref:MDR family MFS transporter n=1 Tax=Ammoniphilus sp. YIM 78166 TaxID=1644106 RepID=UPI00106FF879|nr:MFS transporter [Ammoniphilus sp. YIM 78166]